MKIIINILLVNVLFGNSIDDAFITTFEYGAMLYKNPRGIGCNKCHGNDAKGIFIANYKTKKNIPKTIKAPDITHITLNKFIKKLTSSSRNSLIMPTYFLTQKELKSLYFYISHIGNKE